MALSADPPTERRQREAAIRAVMALPDRDKFRVFETLREYLGGVLSGESEGERQLRLRAEALEAMKQVAAHLDLQPREAPTTEDFDKAAKEIGLDWTSAKIIRAYERWRNATQALKGEWIPRSAQQRIIVRAQGGKRRSHEEYLAGVREWLEMKPAREQMPDYDLWVKDHNARLPKGEKPFVKAHAIRCALPVGWDILKKAALGEVSIDEANKKRIERETDDGAEPLVARMSVSRILGRSFGAVEAMVHKDGFPKPVAKLNGTEAWLREDIEAFRDSEAWPNRKRLGLQKRYVDSAELEQLISMSRSRIKKNIYRERWDKIPEPAGKVGRQWYWRRSVVEKWISTTS